MILVYRKLKRDSVGPGTNGQDVSYTETDRLLLQKDEEVRILFFTCY